jgi:threonine/homoserine/homoserine lactone efflux protein
MGTIDGFNVWKSLATGVVLTLANPKNLLLAIAAATAVAQTGIAGSEQAVAYVVFALIAAAGIEVPLIIYFALGDKAGPILERIKTWMAHNNAVIMTVLFLILGTKLIGEAITGFGS